MDQPLLFKPDEIFGRDLTLGERAEGLVERLLALWGHRPVRMDSSFDRGEIHKDAARKRHRTTDLRCARCNLGVEVRAKRQPMVAVSHSASRPFFGEHQPTDYLAIVSPAGVWFVAFSDLRRTMESAQSRRNGQGEPYLVWPRGTVPFAVLAACSD